MKSKHESPNCNNETEIKVSDVFRRQFHLEHFLVDRRFPDGILGANGFVGEGE